MKKKFLYIIYIIIAFTSLVSCENKSNLEESIYFVDNIKPIQDSIVKLKSYNVKLVVCSLKKTANYFIINLSEPNIPYTIQSNYKYKKIQGVNVLFVDYTEKLIEQEIPKQLIDEKIITFDGHDNDEPPYLEFIFCKNDLNSIKCFNNIQLDDLEQEYRKNKKTFSIDMLINKCEN